MWPEKPMWKVNAGGEYQSGEAWKKGLGERLPGGGVFQRVELVEDDGQLAVADCLAGLHGLSEKTGSASPQLPHMAAANKVVRAASNFLLSPAIHRFNVGCEHSEPLRRGRIWRYSFASNLG